MLVFDNLKAIMGLQTRMRVSPPFPSLPLHALTVGAPCSSLRWMGLGSTLRSVVPAAARFPPVIIVHPLASHGLF